MKHEKSIKKWLLLSAAMATLVACSDGSSYSSVPPPPVPPPVPTPTPTPQPPPAPAFEFPSAGTASEAANQLGAGFSFIFADGMLDEPRAIAAGDIVSINLTENPIDISNN